MSAVKKKLSADFVNPGDLLLSRYQRYLYFTIHVQHDINDSLVFVIITSNHRAKVSQYETKSYWMSTIVGYCEVLVGEDVEFCAIHSKN